MLAHVKGFLKRGRTEKGEGTNPTLPGWKSRIRAANGGGGLMSEARLCEGLISLAHGGTRFVWIERNLYRAFVGLDIL